jgi:hypothetical protein
MTYNSAVFSLKFKDPTWATKELCSSGTSFQINNSHLTILGTALNLLVPLAALTPNEHNSAAGEVKVERVRVSTFDAMQANQKPPRSDWLTTTAPT